MKYTRDLGCRYRGIPHDLHIVHQNDYYKWEACHICNKKFKFKKGYKGRVDNVKYLKAHVRQFCQRGGATKRIYNKIYKPEKTIIYI